jgi:L-lactate dehydrogenase complex protein LldG
VNTREHEHGDRFEFLKTLRTRLASGVPENTVHPLPAAASSPLPIARSSRLVDDQDLPTSFARNAATVAANVHRVNGNTVPDDVLQAIIERHAIRRAVISAEPEAVAVGVALTRLGVDVAALSIAAAAEADLGVTSAIAGIALTGSVVQDSGRAGGRTASLLPRVHLCVLPADRLVSTTAPVLRSLGSRALPSNIVAITGPSRSGDIELIITLGVHGPVAVEVVLLE